jgi:hypothetical protein
MTPPVICQAPVASTTAPASGGWLGAPEEEQPVRTTSRSITANARLSMVG